MPMPREVGDWIARAEIDYLGPFVSAWAAFNAWYRHASNSTKDYEGLLHVRTRQNSVRNAILPYLDPLTADTPEAAAFKQQIAALHGVLEAHRLETDYKGKTEHVSLRSVPLSNGPQLPQDTTYSRICYRVTKENGTWISTVTNRQGVETSRIEQVDYDLAGLTNHADFVTLPGTGQGQLRALYADCNPRPMNDLLVGNEQAIQCGTIPFRCSAQDLFSGVVITIYRMRNMLLHGELSPHTAALGCYGPAYQIVRSMLKHCA